MITWRDVFDTDKNHYGHISIAWRIARQIKYPYMTWNGSIWKVTESGAERTDLKIDGEDSRNDPICLCPATSEYDPPCPRHGIAGIGVTRA